MKERKRISQKETKGTKSFAPLTSVPDSEPGLDLNGREIKWSAETEMGAPKVATLKERCAAALRKGGFI